MPVYEYECKKCEYVFEEFQNLDDSPLANCPECKIKNSLVKLLSASVIQFKGEGWTPKFHEQGE